MIEFIVKYFLTGVGGGEDVVISLSNSYRLLYRLRQIKEGNAKESATSKNEILFIRLFDKPSCHWWIVFLSSYIIIY